MSECPYQVRGAGIALLLGREQELKLLIERLWQLHISVVAPKAFGKTVLLHGLRQRITRDGAGGVFQECLYWDLRHRVPRSDEEFYSAFSQQVAAQVRPEGENLEKLFGDPAKRRFENIEFVFSEILKEQKRRALLIFDGMDNILQSGEVSKNVWDNLRALAEIRSVRFLTGTRRPLSELCASEESRTSDFFNLFHQNPLRLGTLNADDLSAFLGPIQ